MFVQSMLTISQYPKYFSFPGPSLLLSKCIQPLFAMSSTPDKRNLSLTTSNSTLDGKPADSAAATISPIDSETFKRAASWTLKVTRGVTMRPSGKWQAQFYFAGKSRYIGVFDSREKAALAYEIVRERLKSNTAPTTLSLQEVDEIFQAAAHSAESAFLSKNNSTAGTYSLAVGNTVPPICVSANLSLHSTTTTKSSKTTSTQSISNVSITKNSRSSIVLQPLDTRHPNPSEPTSSSSLSSAKSRGLKRSHPTESYRFMFYRDKMDKAYADGCVIVSEGQDILDGTFENLIHSGDSNVKRVFSLTFSENHLIQRKEAILQVFCGNVKFTLDAFRRLCVRDILSMVTNKHEINIMVLIEKIHMEQEDLSYIFSKRQDRSPVEYM